MAADGDGEFESDISRKEQTCEHAPLAYTLVVKQLIVNVNKMGPPSHPIAKRNTRKSLRKSTPTFRKLATNPTQHYLCQCLFVIVAYWNLLEPSVTMSWFKG